jgi:hypothetical protein
MVAAVRLKRLLAGCTAAIRSSSCRYSFLNWLASSPRTFRPLYACRRFTFRSVAARLLATLRSYSEFTGGLGIKLPGDGQILGLLICANAGSGPQTEDAVDLTLVVPFIAQRFLHFNDFVLVPGRWKFWAEVSSWIGGCEAWSRDTCRQHYKDNPSPCDFTG